jgi:molybdenum cofactor cytidylyltransferase
LFEANNIGVVVLAAGSSSRLGQAKQLLQFQNKSLLQSVLDKLTAINFSAKVLVLGANASSILENIEPGKFVISRNHDWSEGIATSIRTGVEKALELYPQLEHVLFLLSDQPFVSVDLLKQLLVSHKEEKKEITACKYKDNIGVPAVFSKSFFAELTALNGDQGAKKIMKQHPNKVAAVEFGLGYFDVDTPEDYEKLLQYKPLENN